MGDVSSSDPPATTPSSPLREGLAGFAVDPARGFGAVLVSPGEEGGGSGGSRAVFAVVSPRDRTTIMSAEALTLIQLAGGIDVAAAVFPPDALKRAAFYDEDDEEAEEGGERKGVARATLVGVEVVLSRTDGGNDGGDVEEAFELPPSSPEREAKLSADAPRLLTASRNLPGLAGATEADVLAALRIHADSEGILDRGAFSEVLDSLRRSLAGEGEDSGVAFVATVAVARDGGAALSTRTVELPAFTALALSMRHKVAVTVSEECAESSVGFGVDELQERFPAFRPMEELEEDAKAVDGFVPEMFFKHKPPEAE